MKQLKITLACAAGMSTTMMCQKIAAAAEKRGYACECKAYAVSALAPHVPGSAIILLGPQVSYQLDKVRAQYPDVPVEVIAMQDYGMMNGEKIFTELMAKYGW